MSVLDVRLDVPTVEDGFSAETVIKRLDRLRGYAVSAEWDDAALVLGRLLREMRKHDRERSWPWGRCDWCWALHNRLRESTELDSGGGGFMCREHYDEMFEDAA